jgi:solute carrier family 10 (sodium/bile acid cotransporter), member 7
MKLKFDWFLWGMAGAVALAWAFPAPGASGGWLHPELLIKAGIALIFFLHGAALPLAALKAGTLKWRVHLVIQSCTFVGFPLLGVGIWLATAGGVAADLRLGYFYLAVLPSTVSSSVALTAAARGNVPVAVFNATLSSLLGIVLTPLWLGLVVQGANVDLPMGAVVLDLVKWLLAPFLVGQLSRPLIGAFIARHKAGVSLIDRGTILMLVYTSFADSFQSGLWEQYGWGTVVVTVGASAAIFAVVMLSVRTICRLLRFDREDTIAAIFCGSKKTLASGVPMAHIIFAGHPGLGLILLPIMVYHSLQLILCAWLAGRWATGAGLGSAYPVASAR